jgi:hypothetical protein
MDASSVALLSRALHFSTHKPGFLGSGTVARKPLVTRRRRSRSRWCHFKVLSRENSAFPARRPISNLSFRQSDWDMQAGVSLLPLRRPKMVWPPPG